VLTWIVGLDLCPSSHGAVRFASWFARSGRPSDDIELLAVHVIEREQLAPIFKLQSPAEVGRRAREALARELEDAAMKSLFDREALGLGAHAHEVLEQFAEREHASAIVVGRQLQKDSCAVIRLGTNARRLLRSLPTTVIVVPPDYAKVSFGPGPILVATDLGDDAVDACRFAARAGERLGRAVQAVHVIPPLDPIMRRYIPEGGWIELGEQSHAEAIVAMRRWLERHELTTLEPHVVQGSTVDAIAELVQTTRSPLLVVGARRLPAVARAFVGSTSAALAAELPVPVAVVPPEPRRDIP
jgi:nucleotide-binding universal stress UspA family protein